MTSRNRPNVTDSALLTSAVRILSEQGKSTFEVKDWRTIMPEVSFIKAGRRATDPIVPIPFEEPTMAKAQAEVKATAFKAATKAAAKKGIVKPKHEPSLKPKHEPSLKPGESAPGVKGVFPQVGVDTVTKSVVQSGLHQPNGEHTVTDATTKTDADLPQATKDKQAATQAKMAEKAAKIEAAAKKKAEAEAAKKAKAAEREAAAKLSKEQREAKAAERAEALKAANPDGKRTYFGSMLTLADKVKAGAYKKGLNGQLRSDDEVARILEVVKPETVGKLIMEVLLMETNPYAHLNIGQQSMNLRNKLRGALRAEEGAGLIVKPGTDTEPPVRATVTRLKELRDANSYATEEDAMAKRAEAKAKKEEARKQAAAEKQANKDKLAKEKAEAKAQTPAAQPAA
jgi:hypothetical protein